MPLNLLYDQTDLLLQVSKGNERAFRQLFDTYRGKLYTYLLKITESRELAEDAVHDVFLKIWAQKEKLTEIQNPDAYFYRMAHNHAINGLRKMARETLVMAELEGEKRTFQDIPDGTLVRKELRQFIHQAVNDLTPQQQEVFRMSRELGLKQAEIADRLGISISTVKKHLTGALNSLRKEIARQYGKEAIVLCILFLPLP